MNIDLEIILREAFVAGYDFRTLKRDGGKGIDCEKWIESLKEKGKKLTIRSVSDCICANTTSLHHKRKHNTYCEECGGEIRFKFADAMLAERSKSDE